MQDRGCSVVYNAETKLTKRRRRSWMAIAQGTVAVILTVVTLSSTAFAEPKAAGPTASEAGPVRHGDVFVDPLGFLLFGPRIGAEFGSQHLAGAVYFRWFNPGLLANSLFLNDGDRFRFSYGGGVRGRYYLQEGMFGLHVGLAIEYLSVTSENALAVIATKSAYLVPQAELGYRFAGRGALFIGGSASAGYALKTSSAVEDLPGGSNARFYQAQDKSSVYGSASLEVGAYF